MGFKARVKKTTNTRTDINIEAESAPAKRIDVIDYNLSTRIRSTDDLMAQILEVNDRLNAGDVSIEHARALTGGFKQAILLISKEIEIAKFSGKTSNTLKRWFQRVYESKPDQLNPNEIVNQLKDILKEHNVSHN